VDAAQFSSYCHEAIHQLMRLNEECSQAFKVTSWPRYEYDLDKGTLTFLEEGSPKVIASICAVGTTSKSSGTWLWGWANESLPDNVTNAVAKVRVFGEAENLAELTQASSPDDEYLGWKLTAITAKLLGSKGAYRCPSENGFIYFVYSSLRFAEEGPSTGSEAAQTECATHGNGFQTFVCEHLASNPSQEWFSDEPSDSNQWPDAWCATCEGFFQEEGEWNDKNESKMKIKLLCHRCYETIRLRKTLRVSGI
jgi:hypothetical protein